MASAAKVQVSGSCDGNAATAVCRYVCAAASAPARVLARIHLHAAGAALSAAIELRQLFPRSLGRAGPWRCAVRLWSPAVGYTYRELQALVNSIANVLVGKLGLVTGGRVLLRSRQQSDDGRVYLAVIKAGGVVVVTMPLLRAKGTVLSDPEGGDRARALRWEARPRRWTRRRPRRPGSSMWSIGAMAPRTHSKQ